MKHPEQVIRELQVTEKGSALTETANTYFFKVSRDANKVDIKRAVETQFNVRVATVNTMRYAGKLKRERSARFGRRPDWKRAIVKLAEGSRIEMA